MGPDQYQDFFKAMMDAFQSSTHRNAEASGRSSCSRGPVQDAEFRPADPDPDPERPHHHKGPPPPPPPPPPPVSIQAGSDLPFKAFLRFLADAIEEAGAEEDADLREKRIQRILENLRALLDA